MDVIDNAVFFDTFMILKIRVRLLLVQKYDLFFYTTNF